MSPPGKRSGARHGPAWNSRHHDADSASQGTSPARHVPATFVELADRALATGEVVGREGVIAVPDLVLLEGAAHRLPIPATFKLLRDDGRSVAFYKWPRGDA